jgi:hypothetical protein
MGFVTLKDRRNFASSLSLFSAMRTQQKDSHLQMWKKAFIMLAP